MEKLPPEIQYNILESLNIEDKFTCLLVSRNWNYHIYNKCLYTHFEIFRNSEKLTQAITYFQQRENLSKQVAYLKIENCGNLDTYKNQLITLFPNVKSITLKYPYSFQEEDMPIDISEPPPLAHIELLEETVMPKVDNLWKSIEEFFVIESIRDDNQPLMIRKVLASLRPNLKRLGTGMDSRAGFRNRNSLYDQQIFKCLFNAPNLTTLSLDNLCFTLTELNSLQDSLAHLKSITLERCNYTISGNDKLLINLPTPKLLDKFNISFKQSDTFNKRLLLPLFTYFANKYAGLKLFQVKASAPEPADRHFGIEEKLITLLRKCPQLKSFEMALSECSTALLGAIDDTNIQLDHVLLHIDDNSVNKQCDALKHSNQINFIRNATVVLIDDEMSIGDGDLISHQPKDIDGVVEAININHGPAIQVLETLRHFSQLSQLKLHRYFRGTNLVLLAKYLKELPSLESIKFCKVYIHEAMASVPMPFTFDTCNIRHIEITVFFLHSLKQLYGANSLFKSIFSGCPHLETFTLYMNLFDDYEYELMEEEDRYAMPFTLSLDFRAQSKLKSVTIIHNHPPDFYIIRDSPAKSGYYSIRKRTLFEKLDIDPDQYSTTILLPHSILLNSVQV